MKKIIPLLLLVACTKNEKLISKPLNTTALQTSGATIAEPMKRIAVSCDGNIHDRDDICAVSMELGIIAKAGRKSSVVYFGYNDHYWKTISSQQSDETNSVLTSAKNWGFDLSKFISVQNYHTTAVGRLKDQINLSSASD